ncbi:MAG: TonB-dependent receptor, partial [Ferruginibacter sp.]|nr:TonB-dependent receptor [Ferruginibacter sp.]
MKQIILILSVTLNGIFAQAQTTAVKGKVIDKNAKAVVAASVSLLNAKDSSLVKAIVTDEAGNYLIENKTGGNFVISATAVGHQKAYSPAFVIFENNISILNNISLVPVEKTLDNVSVVAKKAFIERKLDKTVINVEASITSAGSTAMEVLEKSPGVSVDKDGKISLKGKQGVIILIDGKQTYMGAQDLASYLQAMPAANLDQIELMPNPSSKYDASGNSGVINIKTKRNKQKGFNGSVKNTLAVGRYVRTLNTINLNYKNGKFNVFSTFGVNHRKSFQQLDINRKYYDANSKLNAIFDQTATFIRSNNNNNAKIGVDFYATKKTTIGILFNGSISPSAQDGTNISYLKNAEAVTNSILSSN